MDKIQRALYDFNATIKEHPEYTKEELLKKFPEFDGNEKKLQSAYDYSKTMDSGRYGDVTEFNHKFPEFFYTPSPLSKNVEKATDRIPDFGKYNDVANETPIKTEDVQRLKLRDLNYENPKDEDVRIDLNPYDNKKLNIKDDDIDLLGNYKKSNIGEVAHNELVNDDKYIAQININRLREENLAEIEERKKLQKDHSIDYLNEGGDHINWNPFSKPEPLKIEDMSINTVTEDILNQAEKALNAPKKGSGVGGYFEGYYDKLSDKNTWTVVVSRMSENATVKNTLDKLDKIEYEELTQSEKNLLDAVATRTQAELLREADTSNWYKGGQGVAEQATFILELALTAGVGKAALKTGERVMLELIAKKMAPGLAKHSLSFGTKVVAGLGKAGVAAAVSPSVPINTIGNMSGTVMPAMDGTQIKPGGTYNAQSFLKAAASAYGQQMKEYATEMSGGSLGVAAKYIGGIPGFEKLLSNLATKPLGRFGKGILDSQYVQMARRNPVLKSIYINNPLGEYNEEFDGAVIDHLFGVGDIRESFLNWDAQAVLTLTLAPMAVLGMSANINNDQRFKNKYKKSEKDFTNTLLGQGFSEEDISEIKRSLLTVTPEDAGIQLQQLLGTFDPKEGYELNEDGKIKFDEEAYKQGLKFIFDSANHYAYQGIKNPNALTREERENILTVTNEEGRMMFVKSQQKPNTGQLFALNNKVNELESNLGDEFAFMTMDEIIDYLETEDLTIEQTREIEDYLGERSLLNGVIEAMESQVEQETAQVHEDIDKTTRTDGTRLVVTTAAVNGQGEETFYIADGQIALDDNGNILRGESDKTLLAWDEQGNLLPDPISINSIAKASYQDAEQVKTQIAEDIRNRYNDHLVNEAETDPVAAKTQDGAEITWYENGKPHQGIVIDRADGVVRIQEGNKIVLKNESELNEQIKNPNTAYHLADKVPLIMDGQQYEGEITSEADADGKYSVHVSGYPGKKNFELTAEEITALQTAPVADETAPVADETAPVADETAPVVKEEITPEQQAEIEKETFIATLPKIASGNKAGRVDAKKLTPEQAFLYTKITEGTETAIKDLKDEMYALDSDIREHEKKLKTAIGTAKIDIREDIKGLKERRDNLKNILDREAPGLEAEMKAEAEKKAKNEAEVKAKNEASAEARKNRVLTEEEKNDIHNRIVQLIKEYNGLPANYTQKKRVLFAEISKKASQLGYSTTVLRGGQFSVVDKEGKPIRTISQRTSQEDINEHQLLTEYAPEFQVFALKLMQSMPETLDFPNTNVEKAVKDITAGIKSVAANRMLDRMEEMYSSGEIIMRATAFTPEAVMDIPSYFALFEQETDNDIHNLNEMLQHAPEEFYFEIYDDLITDDNINYINQQFEQYGYEQQQERETRTYPGNQGESTQEAIDGNAKKGMAEQAEPTSPQVEGINQKPQEAKDQPTPTQKQPWEMTLVYATSKGSEKDLPITNSVEVVNGKPIYKSSTTVNWDGKPRTFEVTGRTQPRIEKLHKHIIQQALSEGKQVPEEVLADYPELKKEEVKPIGIDNQIEDVLFGETDEQKKSVAEKVDNVKKNIDRIVSINGKKVYDVSIDNENNIWYNFRKTGINTNQRNFYPLQYANIEYQADVKPEPKKGKPVEPKSIEDIAKEAVKKNEQKVSQAQQEADEALQDFMDAFNDLHSDNLGIVDNTAEKQAKMLVAGTKMVGAYTKLGVYKLADLLQQLQAKGIQITEDLLSAIKKAYGAFSAENDIDALDDMKTVRKFTLNDIQQNKNEDLTPKENNSEKNNVSLNDQKSNNNGQQPRSTEIIESETATIRTTSAADTNSTSNVGSDKQRAGEVKEQATEQIKSVESLLAEVDNKLANLRLTDKSYSTEGIAADYPINVLAKGEIKKDLTKYIKAVAEITGLAHDTNKKGKTEIVNVNIAPAGGDATFFLWSKTNPEHGVYVSIPYDPDVNAGGWYDNYKVLEDGWRATILYRVVNKAKKYDGSNQYMPTNVTAQEMAETLLKGINAELKSKGLAEEQVQEIQPAKAKTKIKKSTQLPKNNNQSNLLSLFGDGEITPTQNEQERGNQETNSGLGSQKPQEVTGLQRTGVDRSSTTDNGVDGGRSSGISDIPATEGTRNKRNNVIPRGKEYAPSSPKARFDANIEAIKTVRRLIDSGNPATKADQETLRQFSGWGGLGTYFNNQHSTENKKLREVLTPEEYESAVMSINSAYYTPAVINNALWDVAEKLGFAGGTVLEGSAGIGNIIGSMPRSMSSNANIEAIEIDEISGNILKYLYPDAKVHIKGFEETNIPNGSVDLAITNVPFVTGLRVYDPIDKDLSRKFKNIHDFCIAKNIRKLKEGGIGIFITSNGTLDKSRELREWIGTTGKTDVIGAFRLNNDTFGGTNVTSDIIIVRKRVANQKHPKAIDVIKSSFVRSGEYETNDQVWDKKARTYVPVMKQTNMEYNDYFKEHPENMGGEMAFAYEKGDTFRPGGVGLYPGNVNQNKQLKQWIETFENIGIEKGESQKQEVAESTEAKEGQLILNAQGQLSLSYRGTAKVLNINSNKVKGQTKAQCLKDYNRIKETLQAVLDYQVANESNEGLKPLLYAFNRAYDNFVAKYGHLNKNTSISFLRNDVDFPSIVSIEKYSETKSIDGKVTKNISKTAVFKDRVVSVKTELKPTNTKDAVIASIYTYGAINLPYIAESQNKTEQEVATEIINSKLGFKDPANGSIVVRHEYLSGDVRSKLKLAQASNDKSEYANNIEELQKVIPMDIPAHLIEFTMGTSWLDKQLYVDYFKEKYNVDATVQHNEGRWTVVPSNKNNETNRAAGVYSEMLGITVYGSDLATAAMNLKPITISQQKKDGSGKTETITDKDTTQAANTRVSEIRDDFKEFVREKLTENKEQADKMAQEYNDRANSYVPMEIDDTYLPERFEGSTESVTLHPHQKKATVRGTMEPLMLAHEVGAGKTFVLISTAMEMRRLGTANKPMIVVQNATVGQFVSSAKTLYPNAKVLTITENDRTPEGRRMFYAKIKYSDWDMIVVPQSTFEMIPDSPEMQKRFIEEKIDEKLHVLEGLKEEDDSANKWTIIAMEKEIDELNAELALIVNPDTTDNSKSNNKEAKKTAKTITNTIARAKEQLDRRTDDVQYFDQMGIDALLVDEAHEYKRLGFATSMTRGVKGIDPAGSKKSAGVYLKTRVVLEKSDWKNIVFATGTPISNTAAEIWTFMKYLMPKETLIENEIYYFDDFVRNFGSINQSLEFATNGSFKENTRFSSYINKPELIRLWASVTDTVLSKDIDAVNEKIPLIEGDKATDIFLPQTPSLIDIMRAVKARLKQFENMTGKEKKENSSIPIVMYGIAKRAAIDTRLVSKIADDEPNSKTNRAVEEALRSLKDSSKYKGTVAIFCDSQNRWDTDKAGKKVKGFDLFEDIKAKLIAKGVAESEIMIIKPGMTVARKEKIFDAVNAGEIRVVLGNTKTLGTGVNMQERLHTLIHMDAPDRPMDYTQRNGRILRQGNLHKEFGIPVRILRFGVEDSLDVTSYQRLKTKAAFIDSIMDGKSALMDPTNPEGRILEEDEEGLFDNPVAVLSGSQYALLKNQAERELRKWESKKKQHEADQIYIQHKVKQNEQYIGWSTDDLKALEKAKAAVEAKFANGINTITIAGKDVTGVEDYVTDDKIRAKVNEGIKPIAKAINEKTEKARENAYFTKEQVFTKLKFNGVEAIITTDIERESQWDDKIRMNRIVMHKRNHLSIPELGLENYLGGKSMMQVIEAVYGRVDLSEINHGIKYVESQIAQYRSDNAAMEARRGKPFAHGEELQAAKEKVVELTELMKQELAAKEEKYKDAGSSNNVDIADVESEEEENVDEVNESSVQYGKKLKVSPVGFYSTVEEALSKIQQGKGTKAQFKQMLLKNGAKQAEMDWMGFDELPEKLTKADIQNWIDENRIEVEEVEKGEDARIKLSEYDNYLNDKYGEDNVEEEMTGEERTIWTKLNQEAEKSSSNTKFSQYVLPGGENYKELLLTMPVITPNIVSNLPEGWELVKVEGKPFAVYGDDGFLKGQGNTEEVAIENALREINISNRSAVVGKNFDSPHFSERNILAHIRFNERTVNGERVLFIEEFQSDWAQEGRQRGFKNIPDKEYHELDERRKELERIGGEYKNKEEEIPSEIKDEWVSIMNRIQPEKRESLVPDMPFKKTDQWVNLALRRMMRYAAENGFDRIAWTNGEQQVDRYDLSNQISMASAIKLQLSRDGIQRYSLILEDNKGNEIEPYARSGKILTPQEMEDTIGKELANKLIEGADKTVNLNWPKNSKINPQFYTLRGVDLKVGGEGMKAFYDGIVPSAMSKLGKPFGAKVENVSMPLETSNDFDIETELYADGTGVAVINNTGDRIAEFDTEKEANDFILSKTSSTQQSIPVTNSMKETALEGMPLFESTQTFINFTPEEQKDETNKAYGSEEKQQEAIKKAITEAEKIQLPGTIGGRTDAGRANELSPVHSLRTVLTGFKESGYVNFNGTEVSSHQDIADLWSIHRSPYIEKSHVVFIKDGKIAGSMAMSSGKIGSTYFPEVETITNHANKLGATQVYFLHNHPSGNPTPSGMDIRLTHHHANKLSAEGIDVLGHVVVDHDKYAFIDTTKEWPENLDYNTAEELAEEFVELFDYKNTKQQLYENRDYLGTSRTVRDNLFVLGRDLLSEPTYKVAIVYMSANKYAGFSLSAYDVLPDSASAADVTRMVAEGLNKNLGRQAVIIHNGQVGPFKSRLHPGVVDVINLKSKHSDNFSNEAAEPIGKDTLWAEQLVGEYGAKNLDKAEEATTRMDNLRVAKDMEGVLSDKEDTRGGVYNSPEYKTADKVRQLLKLRGIDKSFSISDTDFGKSMYFTVYGENPNEPKLKVRISDHGVSNKDRIFGEQHESAKSDPIRIANDIEVAMFPERYNKIQSGNVYYSAYDNSYISESEISKDGKYYKRATIEDSEASFKNTLEGKVRIISKEPIRVSKSGNTIYKYTFEREESVKSEPRFKYERKEKAPELKKFTPQEIRLATGWEKGVDGLWRYETAKHTIHPQLQEYLDKSSDGFIKWINARLNHGLPVNLQDIFGKEDETLKALPQLKSIPVSFASDAELNGAAGEYNPLTKSIRINVRAKNEQDKIFTILEHEVQHAIQDIEGFARGGNPGMFNKQAKDEYDKKTKALEWYNEVLEKGEPNKKGDTLTYASTLYRTEGVKKMITELERDISKLDYIGKARWDSREEAYTKIAGETEARNAARRKDYTPEQRRNTLLSETADVAPEDQIIIMDGLGVSMSMTADEVQAKADKIKNEGLKSVIPDYTKFLTDVYDVIPDSSRRFIIDQARNYGWDIGRATEEYLASFVKGVSPSELEQIAKLAGLQDFAPSEIKMAFWDNFNPKDDSPEYTAKRSLAVYESRDGVLPKQPTVKQVQEAYERIVGGKKKAKGKDFRAHAAFRVEESYANQLASLRVFMDIIGEVPDKYNPYYLMQLYTSAANTAMDRYEQNEFKKMMDSLTSLNKTLKRTAGLTYLNKDYHAEKGVMNAATVYALAKAGLGRNERLSRKNAAEKLQPEYDKLSKQLKKGEIDQETYDDMLAELSMVEKGLAEDINSKYDFGGLTGLAELVGSDAKEFAEVKAVVESIVAEAERVTNTDKFWKDVKNASSYVLTYQYKRGMMSKELYDEILEMEPHYLPLRGYDEKTAGDVYEYFTGFTGEFNPVLKKAEGHEHLPENPFAHLMSMTATGVLQAEKNRSKQALLNLVENHENDLVTVGKSWIRNIGTEEMPEWVDAYPDIPADATPGEVTEAINAFEIKMEQLQAEGRATIKTKKLKLGLPIGKGVPEEHTIKVRRNGEERTLYVNGNPRLAQAINGLLNPDAKERSKWTNFVRSVNRGMSANFTSRNLEFALTNSQRDLHMAIALSAIEQGLGYSAKLAANAVVAQRTLASSIFGSGEKGKYQDYLNEFLEAGGQTGFVHLRDIERYGKDVKKYERGIAKKVAVAVPNFLLDEIEKVNNFAELITRFATYITSREEGRTVTRSAIDAKNITLNFNQKGTGELGASIFQDYVLFFNPAMQALYRSVQASKVSPVKFWVTMGAHAAAGAMAPVATFALMALVAGGDDDELKRYHDSYWNTPEWVRRNNLMVWNPWTKGWHTLALGQELRWAYSIGEIAFTKAMGKEKYGVNSVEQVAGAVTALLPVDMFGSSHWYMPGFATPIYEVAVNENFMGNPIYKSTPWNEHKPEHSKVYKRTWQSFVNISKALNESTGGDDVTQGKLDINPAKAQHLVEGYLGGLVSVYLRGAEVASKAFKGEEYSVNDIPFVRRLYKKTDREMVDSSVKREYFDILDDVKKEFGSKELEWRKKDKEYQNMYNKAIKEMQAQGIEITPETTSNILTPEQIKEWQAYIDKYEKLKLTPEYYKAKLYKDAEKVRKQWEKDGVEFSETDLMLQVVNNARILTSDKKKMKVYLDADIARKQMEEQGLEYSESDMLYNVLENVKAIDAAE